MAGNVCDVCSKTPTVAVLASSLGAMSDAYCAECASAGLEPYDNIVGLAFCIDGLDNAREDFQPMINASLAKAGKTREEADADAQEIQAQYVRDVERSMAEDEPEKSDWPIEFMPDFEDSTGGDRFE